MKNQDHIYIDGKRMNILSAKPSRDGYYKVMVGEGRVPTAEHSIPNLFMEGHDQFSSVTTGGHKYSWQVHPALDESKPEPAPPKPRFERQVVPVLSTNHISEDADRWLKTWDGRRGPIILAPYDAGYFFRVLLDHDDVELIPQSIREVAEWAAAKGYDWVRIDSTVPTIDDLTSYNW